MKKAHIIVQNDRRIQTADALADAGLVHVESRTVESSSLTGLIKLKHSIDRAEVILNAEQSEHHRKETGTSFTGIQQAVEFAEQVHTLSDERRDLQDIKDKLLRDYERLVPWGDFDPSDIVDIEQAGVNLELRVFSTKEWAALPEDFRAWQVNRQKGSIYAALIWEGTRPELDAGSVVTIPNKGLRQLQSEMEEIDRQIGRICTKLQELAHDITILQDAAELLSEYIEFEQVCTGMEDSEQLSVLTGYLQASDTKALKATAREQQWGILIRDPDPEDSPPTQLSNPRWVRIIRPVFNLLGTVPGYREFDISAVFLLFFAVFFGMIISDAGYGSLIFAAGIFFAARTKRSHGAVPDGIILVMVLSIATIIWGALTGNWFGYEPFSRMEPFSFLVIPALHSFEPHSVEFVQRFCFILGLIHMALAFLWSFTRTLAGPHKLKSIGQLGWLTMLVGLFFLVQNVVLGDELPSFSLYLIAAGFSVVTVFGSQEGKFISGIGNGFKDLMVNGLSSVSRFSDIVSYIRLFAVGLASVEIAKSFNAMGIGASEALGGGVAGIIAGAIIILLGHTINLFMATLSVVVHGVRLNMLEFSGALGMEWTGEMFRPFRARAPKTGRDASHTE